jgi:hypothetical protein
MIIKNLKIYYAHQSNLKVKSKEKLTQHVNVETGIELPANETNMEVE